MPRYVTDVDRWISHECRLVKAGEMFDTTFPEGTKLGETLREVKPERAKREKPVDSAPVDDLT